jgi:simple sugar transport system permease protein
VKKLFSKPWFPLLITALVCLGLYAAAALKFSEFRSLQVFFNFFNDNAVLGLAALGLTLVILSGGIDLSVGAVVALTSMLIAVGLQKWNLPPLVAIFLSLGAGAAFGLIQGVIIAQFKLPAFLVTLGGMFLARGLSFILQMESVPLEGDFYLRISDWRIPFGERADLPLSGIIFLAATTLFLVIAQCLRRRRK